MPKEITSAKNQKSLQNRVSNRFISTAKKPIV